MVEFVHLANISHECTKGKHKMKKLNFSPVILNYQNKTSICCIINNEFNETKSGKRGKPRPPVITDINHIDFI